jgi:crotonobetainyl-CoA:carnitine CoA-transferase CaiB-like acyl-CoA transferase
MKLEGVKVIDLSLFLPGPHLTMMMADHGATVIKVEPPGEGEPVRHVGAIQAGHSVWFRNTHRGKKSVCVDLKNPQQHAKLLKLIDEADVVVEGFRPGTAVRLGLGYEALAVRNPRLIYCSISAFGQTGPKAHKPAHDLAIQADSGLVSLNLGADGQPTHPNMPVADVAGSLMGLSGILMALYRREKTGVGDYLDISMQDSLLSWTPNVVGVAFAEQREFAVKQQRSFGGGSFYNIYATEDGRHIVLGGSEAKFASNLLKHLNREDLIPAAIQPPGAAHEPVKAFLRETFAANPLTFWEAELAKVDVCWAVVRGLHEALSDPHLQAHDTVHRDAGGGVHLNNPMRFKNEPAQPNWHVPKLGEDDGLLG